MPRAIARRKYAAGIQFCGDSTDAVDALRAEVVDDALHVCRAVFCVGLHSSYSLFIPYLFALERSRTIGVTSFTPRALAAARAALVRSLISPASSSATEAI